MKITNILTFLAFLFPSILMAGTPVGGGGGSGLVLEDTIIELRPIGRFEGINLLSARTRDLNALDLTPGKILLQQAGRTIKGMIVAPEFVDAVSIKTEDGQNVVIVPVESEEQVDDQN